MGRVWSIESHSQTEVTTPDVALADLAARQHGVVTLAQLQALVCTSFIAGCTRWVTAPPSPLATAMAAVLACGPDAVLSHRSAGALWRILPRWHTPTEVTAPTKHRRNGIHVHRSPHADTTTHYGIPVTTPARTLVDLADVLNPKQLTRAMNEALVLRLVTPAELTTLLSKTTSPASSNATTSRSPSETRPSPATKSTPSTATRRLVIELDSRRFHTTTRAFEQDRDRDADILNAGFSTLRITDHRLREQQANEAKRLRQILSQRDR